jgi:hypothetical protein
MSKSKGTFLMASTWLKHLPPGPLRYYYASKLGPGLDDIDLNFDEFIAKVNTDLVNKVVNLASRCAGFLAGSSLATVYPNDGGLFTDAAARGEAIAGFYEDCNYNAAMREIMALADKANRYVDDQQPWVLKRDPARTEQLREVCSVILNLFRQIVVYLSPVLPQLRQQTEQLLNHPIHSWNDSQSPLTGTPVSPFQHLMKRLDPKQVEVMLENSRHETAAESAAAQTPPPPPPPLLPRRLPRQPQSRRPRLPLPLSMPLIAGRIPETHSKMNRLQPSAPSRTSRKLTCVSPAFSKQTTSKAPTNCCNSHSPSVAAKLEMSSPASKQPTSRRTWSVDWSFALPTSNRDK